MKENEENVHYEEEHVEEKQRNKSANSRSPNRRTGNISEGRVQRNNQSTLNLSQMNQNNTISERKVKMEVERRTIKPIFFNPLKVHIQLDYILPKIEKIPTSGEVKSILKPRFLQPPKVQILIDSSIHFTTLNYNAFNEKINLIISKPTFFEPPKVTLQLDFSTQEILKTSISTKEESHFKPYFMQPPKVSLYENRESKPALSQYTNSTTENSESRQAALSDINNEEEELLLHSFDLYSYLSDFTNKATARGPYLIVYDENKKGIEYSLSRIAVELAEMIADRKFNPNLILPGVDPISSTINKFKEIGEGIYVLSPELCKKMELNNPLFDVMITALIGDKFSIIIMPKCLYNVFKLKIGFKPLKIIEENFTKEDILTLTYLALGLERNFKLPADYGSLADTRGYYENILDESWKWLQKWLLNNFEFFTKWNILGDQEPNNDESLLHKQLKAVTIRHLIENKKVNDPKSIKVEEEIKYNNLVLRPDIYVETTKEIYDAKTSYGKLPSEELADLYKKYSIISTKIYAVMRPLPVLLDLHNVRELIKSARKNGIKLSVLIPVKENDKVELMDLLTFLKKGKEYYENIKKGKEQSNKT